MNSLAGFFSAPPYPGAELLFKDTRAWQFRLVPATGVVLSDAKIAYEKDGLRTLALDELQVVHLLADAINSEKAWRITTIIQEFELTAKALEPLLAAINLELAVTGRRKKFVLFENGQFKARTFSGGVVFQHTFSS